MAFIVSNMSIVDAYFSQSAQIKNITSYSTHLLVLMYSIILTWLYRPSIRHCAATGLSLETRYHIWSCWV